MPNLDSQSTPIAYLHDHNWELLPGSTWFFYGPNGSGKTSAIECIKSQMTIERKIAIVSFEEQESIIEREKYFDDSEFSEGGFDQGSTCKEFIKCHARGDSAAELLTQSDEFNQRFQQLCKRANLESVLHTGLRLISTGEFRKACLVRAILQNPAILILDEPLEGLDELSKLAFIAIVEKIITDIHSSTQTKKVTYPEALIWASGRMDHKLPSINNILNFYQNRTRLVQDTDIALSALNPFVQTCNETADPLITMENVTVSWDSKIVLKNLSWQLFTGDHTLVHGPNGSGKSTLLNLISGDCPQVYCNNICIFGTRRGSGESIWDIKARIGMVSTSLHHAYTRLGDTKIPAVLVSGFHDSIGLYQAALASELEQAFLWLEILGLIAKREQCFHELSYGEQRALLVARAAIKKAPLLLLDEPCHNLDDDQHELVLHAAEHIANTGTSTVLYVTHNKDEYLPSTRYILELGGLGPGSHSHTTFRGAI